MGEQDHQVIQQVGGFANEVLSAILCSAHNVRFYERLMQRAREAIAAGSYAAFRRDFLEEYGSEPGSRG